MVKVMLVSSINPEQKTGYFNAVNDRVKEFKKNKCIELKSYAIYKSSSLFKFAIKKDKHHLFIEYPRILPSHGFFSFISLFLIRVVILFFSLRFKPNVIHAHWGYPIAYAATSLKSLSQLKNVKFIVTFHGSDVHTHPLRHKDILEKTKRLCTKADHITAVSQQLLLQLKDLFIVEDSKLSVTYNGVMFDRKRFFQKAEKKTLSFLGNLNKIKGADRIISLYEELTKLLDHDFVFVVAGEGPELEYLQKYVKDNNINNLTLLGAISRQDATNLMKISDCVFILSRREGLGISAIEGLFYSNLCIATDVGGLSEVFKYNEELIISGEFDASVFANKYISTANGKYNIERDYILNNFSLEKIIDRELALYKKLSLRE